jgi:uncharacterized phage infection (PIP) family protein YhgE
MTKLQEVQERLAQLDPNNRDNLVEIARLNTEIEQLKQAEQEQAMREQKTEELLDEYNDTLVDIFSTLFPEDKYKVLLGVNEYENLRQDYKRVHKAFHAGQIEKINADHVAELNRVDENWREKFGRLTKQAQDTEDKLAVANELAQRWAKELDKMNDELNDAHTEISKLKLENEEISKSSFSCSEELKKANERIAELEAKLEQANKPKEPAQNESLNNVLNEIKSRKQDDPDAVMQRFLARQVNGPKVMSIDHGAHPELPVLQFRPEVAPAVVEQGADPLPIVDSQFQSPEGNQPIGLPVSEDGAGGGVEESPVTRAEFEALEKRVKKLEQRFERPVSDVGVVA